MRRVSIGLLVFALSVGAVVFFWYKGTLPSFDSLRGSRHEFSAYVDSHPVLGVLFFSFIYIAVVAGSIPLATPLSLLAGFLFGTFEGVVIVVLSATIGATITFLLSRYFFRSFFEEKTKNMMQKLHFKSTTNGFKDVFIARLIPAVPFSLINIIAGLTQVRLGEYVLATILGIIPFSFVYVHSGMRLSEITSIKDIASSASVMFFSRIALVLFVLYILRRYFTSRKTSSEL